IEVTKGIGRYACDGWCDADGEMAVGTGCDGRRGTAIGHDPSGERGAYHTQGKPCRSRQPRADAPCCRTLLPTPVRVPVVLRNSLHVRSSLGSRKARGSGRRPEEDLHFAERGKPMRWMAVE